MPSTWKQCTHIFINTLTWYYARSIFPDQSTLIGNITGGILCYVDDIFRRSGESECILALHACQVDFELIPPREILRWGLNWRRIFCETGLLLHPLSLTGGSTWATFPPSANAWPCMTFLESRIQLITWTQVLGLDILASIFNKDSNCTKPRYWSSKISDHLWRRYLPPVTLISNNKV